MNETSTQLRYWHLGSEDLQTRRHAKFQDALAHHVAKRYPENARKELPVQEMEKEEAVIHYYLEQLDLITKEIDDEIFSTAAVFFKRFYLNHSILKYDPHLFMLTSLYLAMKTHENFKAIDKFIRDLPESARMPSLEKQSIDSPEQRTIADSLANERDYIVPIVQAEFELLAGLKFHLMVHVPYKSLYGFLLDSEVFIFNSIDRDTPMDAKKKLMDDLHARACKQIRYIFIHTDAPFQFSPAQIAFYAFYTESQALLVPITSYLETRFSEIERQKLLHVVSQCQQLPHHSPSTNSFIQEWTNFYKTHLPWYSLLPINE